MPSIAVSGYEPIETKDTAYVEPDETRELPKGVPNEHTELFGANPTPTGGVDAVWANSDGTYSSSDGSTYNPETGEGTYDVGEDSFDVDKTRHGITALERHPDRVRTSEALKVVEHDPNKMVAAHGPREAFDYYRNPNIDGIRELAVDQIDARIVKTSNQKDADKDPDYVAYTSTEGGVELGRLNADLTKPHFNFNAEKGKLSAGLGGVDVEATGAQLTREENIGELVCAKGQLTVGTVNSNLKMEGKAEIKGLKSEVSLKARGGAEAIVVEGRLEGTVTITPKSVGDQFVELYNDHVDPIIDKITGKNVPDLPEVPEFLDHGIILGGHLEGGVGASLKGSIGLDVKNGFKLEYSLKGGAPLVGGHGGTIGLK